MAAKEPGFELFAHGADVGIRGWGADLATAFAQAAVALSAAVTDPERIEASIPVKVSCTAPDNVTLFVDWINAIILEMATRSMLFRRFDVELSGEALSATLWGETVDAVRHEPATEPKGATFTLADVRRNEDGTWIAQCVVDV
jgi:SHS2 domain-containing protein